MVDSSADILRRLDEVVKNARIQQLADVPAAFIPWQIDSSEDNEIPRFSVVAPSFGHLKRAGQILIDETLEGFIRSSLVSLEKILKSGRSLTWSTVSEEFMQSPYMKLDPSKTRDEHRLFKREEIRWSLKNTRSKRDENVVREIEAWLHMLLNDTDVIESTKIPIVQIADIVARTGLLHYNEAQVKRVEKPFVETGILRYPDFSSPHIRIYRIKLVAWASCKRKGLRMKNRNGIEGHFLAYHFDPRDEFIRRKREMATKMELEADGGFL